jgi:uncharacterized delta-60 repeat protein
MSNGKSWRIKFMKDSKFQIKRPANPVVRLSHRLLVAGVVALLICWPMPNRVHAAVGDLDPTFGSGGKVTTNFFNIPRVFFFDHAADVALQSDGKIVAAGYAAGAETNFKYDFVLARYNTDGSLDSSFGVGGKVSTDFSASDDVAFAVAIQPDGKIIAVGWSSTQDVSSDRSFALVRYNTDGSLDSSFGAGGKVTTRFFNADDFAAAVVLQPDGKIVAAGAALHAGASYDFAAARYNTDGSLDSSFGVGGKVTIDFFGNGDQALAIARQPDGKLVLAGIAFNLSTDNDFALVRYNIDGTLDSSFGAGGKVTTDIAGFYDIGNAVAIQADGKIVVVGNAVTVSGSGGALTRYKPDGSLDTTFGSGGKIFNDFFDNANDVKIQPSGKIIVAGVAGEFGSFDFGLMRYNPDGSPDAGFGAGGKVTTDFFGSDDRAFAIALQPDSKIVLAGSAYDINTNNESFALARYTGDGASFDVCLQDDSNGNILRFNSTTGDYQFTICSSGLVLGGTGSLIKRGSTITLQHDAADRRVLAKVDGSLNKGTASIQVFSLGRTFTILDRNTSNNACACR